MAKNFKIGNNKTSQEMVDDILNTGQTFVKASKLLTEQGATEIYACASHALLCEGAKADLDAAPIQSICVTDSCLIDDSRKPNVVHYITCADLMGEAMKRIQENTPMSPLFRLSIEDQK